MAPMTTTISAIVNNIWEKKLLKAFICKVSIKYFQFLNIFDNKCRQTTGLIVFLEYEWFI